MFIVWQIWKICRCLEGQLWNIRLMHVHGIRLTNHYYTKLTTNLFTLCYTCVGQPKDHNCDGKTCQIVQRQANFGQRTHVWGVFVHSLVPPSPSCLALWPLLLCAACLPAHGWSVCAGCSDQEGTHHCFGRLAVRFSQLCLGGHSQLTRGWTLAATCQIW